MNAKEARELAESINRESAQIQIHEIRTLIEGAAKRGYLNCTYDKSPEDVVVKYFETEGYTIKYVDGGRNDYYYKISW